MTYPTPPSQQQTVSGTQQHHRPRLQVSLAQHECEVREAQHLRYKVFSEEMGARLVCKIPEHDTDLFDPWCDHLLVRDEASGKVVGTYRILSPEAAQRVGSYYSENEFSLTRLQHIRGRMVEIGRSCIHRDYRNGAVIALLWSGLAAYMHRGGYNYLIGCASIGMNDGGHNAANIYRQLADAQQAPLEYRVFPHHPLPFEHLADGQRAQVPPLLKGYLRAGGLVCGEPAWDPDFNTADLLLMLPMARLSERYARHFIGPSA
ncbi:MAG: GNAT family N-acetyltransferase [Betaproteobacteria bacterium HGW-Betaproteobacteria-11]|nr:MAG: GNAT family N-acetyltransferase [Betaproteobacteria bacterium HGW-Betaproteobacteria-11]